MERIVKISKTLRNNWKKSTLGAIALLYGASTVKKNYDISILMTAACKEAEKYGNEEIPIELNHRTITVILNPAANKRNAKKEFERYCEPLFHLAGVAVNVIQTTHEGHAKDIAETLQGTEAVIVAGGDGTLAETITGLFRRNDDGSKIPIGVLPVGRTNCFGSKLFPNGEGVKRANQLIEATMAIIRENTTQKDVMKIERLYEEEQQDKPKPLYALSSIEWGAFRDAIARKDKYWFLGSFRDYATYIFNGYKNSLSWDCRGEVRYTPPCIGCLNCVEKKQDLKKKWSFFMPSVQTENDLTLHENPLCKQVEEKCFKAVELRLTTQNIEDDTSKIPYLKFTLGKTFYTYSEFVSEGWRFLNSGKRNCNEVDLCRTIEILPESLEKYEKAQIAIDNEEFDVRPFRVTLLPRAIKVYCNKDK